MNKSLTFEASKKEEKDIFEPYKHLILSTLWQV